MEVFVTESFRECYSQLNRSIQRKVIKQKEIFEENPFHPSLHTEKLIPKRKEIWSIRVDKKHRILLRFNDGHTATFLLVGSHDWIYRRV